MTTKTHDFVQSLSDINFDHICFVVFAIPDRRASFR